MAKIMIFNEDETKYWDEEAITAVSDYIIRGSANIGSQNCFSEYVIDGFKGVQKYYGIDTQRLIHLVVSFNPNSSKEPWQLIRLSIVADTIAKELDRYQILWGVHLINNPHIHLMINPVNCFTGENMIHNTEWKKQIVCICKEVLRFMGIDGRSIRYVIREDFLYR